MHWAIALVGGILVGFVLSKIVPVPTQKKAIISSAKNAKAKKDDSNTSSDDLKIENTNNKETKGKNDNKKKPKVSNEEYKMVLVVRNDLQMGKGKIAAQCSHATLGAFVKAQKKDPAGLAKWEEDGQAKVVVRATDEDEMLELEETARKAKLVTYIVVDAGRTQVQSGTSTVLAVGPGPISRVNEVTGKLKLL